MGNAMTNKVIVLGVDGMDPNLAKKFLDKGVMPNLEKILKRGSAREDLHLLGGMPTVTPPMWTTLSTGAYPQTHGIMAFNNPHPTKIDYQLYSLDSRMCKAEQMWDVLVDAGKKVAVWHWPGSSWPPTKPVENLMVVDGTQPAAINMGVADVDGNLVIIADAAVAKTEFRPFVPEGDHALPGAGCIITDIDDILSESKAVKEDSKNEFAAYIMSHEDEATSFLGEDRFNYIDTSIKPATGWATPKSEGALEFSVYTSNGLVRRPALILKNVQGVCDTVCIYKNKKELEPLVVVKVGEYNTKYVDEVVFNEQNIKANRCVKILEMSEDGSRVRLWLSTAYDVKRSDVWFPNSLMDDVIEHVGYVLPVCDCSGRIPEYVQELMIPSWEAYAKWQAKALQYLLDDKHVDVLFSHLHNIDLCGHQIWHLAKHRDEWNNDEKFYQDIFEQLYIQTDAYFGEFVHYLDENATLILVSDHGLITEENETIGLGDGGVNGTVMKKLGYSAFVKDEAGKDLPQLDYSKTKAVACRGFININLKGRYPYGIVEPEDKYELEAQIISDLYNYRDPKTGKRIVSLALRTKDADILGMNYGDAVDIVYFMEEGYNIIHMDSLPSQEGYFDTSVSPFFVAAGKGIKHDYKTSRIIRQVDVAPTIATLCGVRMPHECEGAPIYQILDANI